MKTCIYINIFCCLCLITSCKTQIIVKDDLYGTFYYSDKANHFTSTYFLELRPDGTFFLKEIIPQCEGKWNIITNKYISLICNEAKPYEELQRGYMYEREHLLEIIDKNRIKYKDVILRRKK